MRPAKVLIFSLRNGHRNFQLMVFANNVSVESFHGLASHPWLLTKVTITKSSWEMPRWTNVLRELLPFDFCNRLQVSWKVTSCRGGYWLKPWIGVECQWTKCSELVHYSWTVCWVLSQINFQIPRVLNIKDGKRRSSIFRLKEGAHIGGMAQSVTKLVWFGYISHLSNGGWAIYTCHCACQLGRGTPVYVSCE